MSLSILLLRSSNTNNSNNNNNNSKENQDVATIDNKDSTIASDTNKSLSEGISKLQSLSLVEGPNATDKSVDASSSTDGNTKPLTTISETLSEAVSYTHLDVYKRQEMLQSPLIGVLS